MIIVIRIRGIEKMKHQKITKGMTVAEIIEKKPKAAETLAEEGLGCAGCMLSSFETLEQGAAGHGIDVDELVEELNKEAE